MKQFFDTEQTKVIDMLEERQKLNIEVGGVRIKQVARFQYVRKLLMKMENNQR